MLNFQEKWSNLPYLVHIVLIWWFSLFFGNYCQEDEKIANFD